VESFFLDDFDSCRRAFKDLAKRALRHFPHSAREKIPVRQSQEPIDTLLLRRGRKASSKLVILSSGVHGVEGFAGSAVQRKLLSDMLSGALPVSCDVLFLHGVNPYGFRNLRRVNESNVDLNRNFYFKKEKVPQKEHNHGYRRLVSFLNPEHPFTFWWLEFLVHLLRFGGLLLRLGPRHFMDSVVNGQFEYKRGIYYGGRRPQPVVKHLRRYFRKALADYRSILLLDIHTGYGEKDGLIFIQNAAPGSAEDKNIARIAGDVPLLRESTNGFYRTAGDFTDFPGRVFPKKEIYPLTLEIGTDGNMNLRGAITSSFLVVAENRIHHHGCMFASNRTKVKEKFLRLFYPARDDWKRAILTRSVKAAAGLINRFSVLGS